mgnify:FL=1|jgi:hypothetical protein
MRALAHKATSTIQSAASLYLELVASALTLIPRRTSR